MSHVSQVCLGLTLLADNTGAIFGIVTAQNLPLTLTSYLLPILICLRTKERLLPGPWNTGRWGPLVRSCAAAYVIFTMIVSMLPASYPTTMENPPYAPIMWLACLIVMQVCWWIPKIGGRHYYSGPISASIGGIAFAITSPVLVPTSRPPWYVRMFTKASPVRTPAKPHLTEDGYEAGSDSGSASGALPWLPLGWLWRLLGPSGQCLHPNVEDVGHDVRQSPHSFYRQQVLRIPGEREALSRAQKSPVHPSGYAWDREAAKRLGHGTRVVTSQKRINLGAVAEADQKR